MKSVRSLLTITFAVAVLGLILTCDLTSGGGSSPTQPPSQPTVPSAPQPSPKPNLAIVDVRTYPGQPRVGQAFTISVYVTNNGNAVSGDYDLGVTIKDVGRGDTYPVGRFHQSALHPGEQVSWQKDYAMVNNPGSYQCWVDLYTSGEDGNLQDNSKGWAFQVTQ